MGQLFRSTVAAAAPSATFALSALSPAFAAPPPGLFVDATVDSGLIAEHDPSGTLVFAASMIADLLAPVVVGDFDKDGWQDVFVVSSGSQPDRLFINNRDGTFHDRAHEWGVDVKHMGFSACVGDYDDDGWPDIYVMSAGLDGSPTSKGKHRLYRNLGGRAFEQVAAAAGVALASPVMADGLGCAFGDYDLDGDLDLVTAGYFAVGKGNRLFRNNGDATFTDVTVATGLSPLPVFGFSPRLCDMDGDRWPELLLAADFHTSRYFVNQGGRAFVNATSSSGTGTDDNGMGSVVADLDGDGKLDWFVTSISGSPSPESPATGNRLYRSMGAHTYVDVAAASGVKNGTWAWGATAVDLDHDGDLDLVQVAGWSTQPQFANQPARIWINDGFGQFTDIAPTSGLWHTLPGRGIAAFDADNDGDRDIIIASNKNELRFYRNELITPSHPVEGRHWLRLEIVTLDAPRIAPHGIGTVIDLTAGGVTQRRVIDGGTNFQSQDELAAHFGVGTATVIDEVRVRWSDGTCTLLREVAVDQRLAVEIARRCDLDGDAHVDGADLATVLGAWGPIDPVEPADLDASGAVDALDVVLLLKSWGL